MRPPRKPCPQAVRFAAARASERFREARELAWRAALAEIGPNPTIARLRELGGFTAVAERALTAAAPAPHDEPPYGDDAGWLRRALLAETAELRTELQIYFTNA